MGLFDRFKKKNKTEERAAAEEKAPEEKALEEKALEEAAANVQTPEPEAPKKTAPEKAAVAEEVPEPEWGESSDSWDEEESLSLSMSKGSVVEETKFTEGEAWHQKDSAENIIREEGSISNESITRGISVLETYEVVSDAIKGGMGSVWKVHHKSWNSDLAMKRPQPKYFAEGSEKRKENFIHECESWINLGLHPNIVSCYYVREIGGVPTIFSEWMENGSLKNRIDDETLYEGTKEEVKERLLDIAIQFARGLHYAHESEDHLIHQDVKPDNLLLSNNWEAKVADFGLAKARTQMQEENKAAELAENDMVSEKETDFSAGATHMAPTGGYTPAYCSSEQYLGETLTRRTDIYSWAVSVLEMYLGKRPWKRGVEAGRNCGEYLEQTRVEIPESLKTLLTECLAEEEENRPHDFGVIEDVLKEIYREIFGKEYPRSKPKAAADTADSLNNRALSYLDLGKTEEAEKLWEKALKNMPNHLQSIYNQGLYQWRRAEIDDEELLRRCAESNQAKESEGLGGRWLAQLNGERGSITDMAFSGEENSKIIGDFQACPGVAINREGTRVYSLEPFSKESRISLKCWDAETGQCIYEVDHNEMGTSVTFPVLTGDEKYLIYCTFFGTYREKKQYIVIADARTGAVLHKDAAAEQVRFVKLHPDDRHFTAVSYHAFIEGTWFAETWDIHTGKKVFSSNHDQQKLGGGDSLYFNKDVSVLYLYRGYRMFKWDLKSGCYTELPQPKKDDKGGYVYAGEDELRVSDDEQTFYLVNHRDQKIRSWTEEDTMITITETKTTPYKLDPLILGFESRENKEMIVEVRAKFKLFHTDTCRCRCTVFGHEGTILRMAASEKYLKVVTGGLDKTLRLWNRLEPKEAPWELSVAQSYRDVSGVQEKAAALAKIIEDEIQNENLEDALKALLEAETLSGTGLENDFIRFRKELTQKCKKVQLEDVFEFAPLTGAENARTFIERMQIDPETGEVNVIEDMEKNPPHPPGEKSRLEDVPEGIVAIASLAYSPSGAKVAAGCNDWDDNKVFVWDNRSGKMEHTYSGLAKGERISMAFSPDETKLLIGIEDDHLELWDVQTHALLQRFSGCQGRFTDVCFTPNGKSVVSATDNGMLYIHSVANGQLIRSIQAAEYCLTKLCIDPQRRLLYVRSICEEVTIWSLSDWKKTREFVPHPKQSYSGSNMCLTPDGQYLITATFVTSTNILVWKTDDLSCAFTLKVPQEEEGIHEIAVSPDGCFLCVAAGNTVYRWLLKWELTV